VAVSKHLSLPRESIKLKKKRGGKKKISGQIGVSFFPGKKGKKESKNKGDRRWDDIGECEVPAEGS